MIGLTVDQAINGKGFERYICILCIALAIFTNLKPSYIAVKDEYAAAVSNQTEWHIVKSDTDPTYINGGFGGLSYYEYEALLYVRDNTPTDSVIVSTRRYMTDEDDYTDDCRNFYYSAFSERQQYCEGFSYSAVSTDYVKNKVEAVNELYAALNMNREDALELMDDMNVDYAIISKERDAISLDETLMPDGLTIYFENYGYYVIGRAVRD